MTTRERFDSKIATAASGCIVWRGHTVNGYGRFSWNGVDIPAHRAALLLEGVAIPKSATVDHLCRNRACVNINHLQLVANRENVLRGIGTSAMNARKTHCKRGHELTGTNLIEKRSKHGWMMRNCRECVNAAQRAGRLRRKASCQ